MDSSSENIVPATDKPQDVYCVQKCLSLLKLVTVEPVMFCYMMAFMITSVVEQQFFIDKACLVDLSFSKDICYNLSAHPENNKQVQTRVSTFHQYNDIASQVIPILLALFIGAWSDRRGRKLLLLLGLAGKLWYSVWIVIISLQESWGVNNIIYIASFPSGITGADLSIFAASFSYISDITSLKQRTFRVSILDIVYLLSMPIGIAIGKAIFNTITDREAKYTIMFSINSSLLFLGLIYTFLRLDWATTPQQRPFDFCCLKTKNKLITKEEQEQDEQNSKPFCIVDFFDVKHLIQTIKTLVKKRPIHGRTFLIILIISMALYTFQRDERQMSYLYTVLQFEWDVNQFSDFRTFQSAAYVVGSFLFLPFMGKVLKLSDTTIVMIGTAGHAVARIIYATTAIPWLFYLGACVSSIGPIVAPVLRSMASKIVPTTERGKVFAMMSVADTTVPLFSGIIYSQVYNATIDTYPAAIYWVTVTSQLVVFISALLIKIRLRGRQLEECALDR